MRGPTLVLTKFVVSRSPADGTYVIINGRPKGVLAFILRLFGLAGNTAFRVTGDRVTVDGARLSGKFFNAAPIGKIASTHCDFSRNIVLLFLAVWAIIGALFVVVESFNSYRGVGTEAFIQLAVGLVLGGLFFWGFLSSRTMSVSVETDGGRPLSLRFKQGVIDGVSVDFAKVEECILIINHLVVQASVPRA